MAKAAMPAQPMTDDDDMDAASDDGDTGTDASGASNEADHETLVTICKGPDGGYIVYDGDEPEAGEGDEEDAGGEGGGKQVASIGEALKAALDILNEDESSEGGEGSSEDQFQAGYDDTAPPTAKTPQKY